MYMKNPIYEAMDTASLLQDISERQHMIEKYMIAGELDRNDAIHKIIELRNTDHEVLIATSARLTVSATPFELCRDDQIVAELQMQMEILMKKLQEKDGEGTNHADT